MNIRSAIKKLVPPILWDLLRSNPARHQANFDLPVITLEEIIGDLTVVSARVVASQIERSKSMVLPLADLLSVASICQARVPKQIFEIGTYTGSTTLVMAQNLPTQTKIFTLDLDPADLPAFLIGKDGKPVYEAGVIFKSSRDKDRICQLFGDSSAFDFTPYQGKMDLVFVDADHSYDAVLRDSKTAISLLAPGGIVIWDDYRWLPEHSECSGVTRALNSLAARYPIRQLDGTRLAICLPGANTN